MELLELRSGLEPQIEFTISQRAEGPMLTPSGRIRKGRKGSILKQGCVCLLVCRITAWLLRQEPSAGSVHRGVSHQRCPTLFCMADSSRRQSRQCIARPHLQAISVLLVRALRCVGDSKQDVHPRAGMPMSTRRAVGGRRQLGWPAFATFAASTVL